MYIVLRGISRTMLQISSCVTSPLQCYIINLHGVSLTILHISSCVTSPVQYYIFVLYDIYCTVIHISSHKTSPVQCYMLYHSIWHLLHSTAYLTGHLVCLTSRAQYYITRHTWRLPYNTTDIALQSVSITLLHISPRMTSTAQYYITRHTY